MNSIERLEAPPQILRLKEVQARTGMGRSFIYKEMAAKPPRFPKNFKIGARASGWSAVDVDDWIRDRQAGVAPSCREA